MTPAATPDADGHTVTYADASSTCASPSIDSTTGAATFTAPAKGATCVMRVRAYDGADYSSAVSSATITGGNNAPAAPSSVTCTTSPLGGAASQTCTLTPAATVDVDGDSVTYADASSTCASPSIDSTTGAATFTAPAKGATCVMRIKANDGTADSSVTSSATITGQNNAPNAPASVTCPTTPVANSAGNACTLTAAATLDVDGDAITYTDDGSTCPAFNIDSSTGAATFTAPALDSTCVLKIRTFDGTAYSSSTSSATLTGTAATLAAATGLGWSQTSPTNLTNVTAAWTVSSTPGTTGQKIQYYTGANCDTTSGSLIDLASAATATDAFTGSTGTTYTYKVTTTDAQGSIESACSSALVLDSCVLGPSIVTTGDYYTCTLVGGTPKCWGNNAYGQLGDGTTEHRASPVMISGLEAGVVNLAAGANSTCAITEGGALQCWGSNSYGQIGDGTGIGKETPTLVSGMSSGVTSVTGLRYGACAIQQGAVKCWGVNWMGQLGVGHTIDRMTPVSVSGLNSEVVAISGGTYHTCAIIRGALKCWGSNSDGKLGDGTSTIRMTPVAVSGMGSDVTAVSAADSHTCAIVSGALKCWGMNSNGQLGDGTWDSRTTPALVSGMGSGVTAVSAGTLHTCAIVNGAMKCWGSNGWGRLGAADTTSRNTPVTVSGMESGVTAIDAGYASTCAVASGKLHCWGQNIDGQLGDGTTTHRYAPTQVVDIPGASSTEAKVVFSNYPRTTQGIDSVWDVQPVAEIQDSCGNRLTQASSTITLSAASNSSCSQVAAGTLNAINNSLTPSLGIAAFAGVSYSHSLSESIYLKASASGLAPACTSEAVPVFAASAAATNPVWVQSSPQGVGSVTASWTPSVSGQISIQKIQYYEGANCESVRESPIVLDSVGTSSHVLTAPDGEYTYRVISINTNGVVNYSACSSSMTIDLSPPADPVFFSTDPVLPNGSTSPLVIGLASADTVSVKIFSDSECTNEVGSGSKVSFEGAGVAASVPSDTFTHLYGKAIDFVGNAGNCVPFTTYSSSSTCSPGASIIASGDSHACAVVSGALRCWGSNSSGRLGDGTTTTVYTPTLVSGMSVGVTAVKAGAAHSCAIVSGALRCWGLNTNGRLGDGTITLRVTPNQVSGLSSGVTAVATGSTHTCAIVNGGLRCWGANTNGRLGNGASVERRSPVQVSGLTSGVTAVATGNSHTCAIVNGGLRCWGQNSGGQIGDGTSTQRLTPTVVSGMSTGVTAVSTGYNHTCAIVNRSLKCWGTNSNLQLGDGTSTQRTTPTTVSGMGSGVTAVSAGYSHSCAIVNGALRCWGFNYYGSVGDGTTIDRATPVEVLGMNSGVTEVSAGTLYTCATRNGFTKCWGSNSSGRLGLGNTVDRILPAIATVNGAVTAATQLAFTRQPITGNAGVAFSIQPEVTLRDACGNVASGANNSITLSASTNGACSVAAGGSVNGTNPVSAQSGIVSFTNVNYSTNATIYLKASAAGLTDACSASTLVVSP